MKCKSYRTEIEEANPGAQLSAGASRHLRDCAACRKFYEERLALRNLLGGLEVVTAPPDFEFRLRARLAAGKASKGTHALSWRRFAPGAVSIALAACFALTVAVVLRFNGADSSVAPLQTSKTVADARPSGAATTTGTTNETKLADDSNRKNDTEMASAVNETRGSRNGGRILQTTTPVRVRAARPLYVGEKTQQAAPLSNDLTASLKSAAVLTPNGAGLSHEAVKSDAPLAVPVNTSAEPLRLLLSDEQGAARVVSIKSVSFGGQELVVRPSGARRAPSVPVIEGVW